MTSRIYLNLLDKASRCEMRARRYSREAAQAATTAENHERHRMAAVNLSRAKSYRQRASRLVS